MNDDAHMIGLDACAVKTVIFERTSGVCFRMQRHGMIRNQTARDDLGDQRSFWIFHCMVC